MSFVIFDLCARLSAQGLVPLSSHNSYKQIISNIFLYKHNFYMLNYHKTFCLFIACILKVSLGYFECC